MELYNKEGVVCEPRPAFNVRSRMGSAITSVQEFRGFHCKHILRDIPLFAQDFAACYTEPFMSDLDVAQGMVDLGWDQSFAFNSDIQLTMYCVRNLALTEQEAWMEDQKPVAPVAVGEFIAQGLIQYVDMMYPAAFVVNPYGTKDRLHIKWEDAILIPSTRL